MISAVRRKLCVLAFALFAIVGSIVAGGKTASAATPFVCTNQAFLAQGVSEDVQLYSGASGAGEISFGTVGPPSPTWYNAIGYNLLDNHIYGIRRNDAALWRVDASGAGIGFGRPVGLPALGTTVHGVQITQYYVGAMDFRGLLYVTQGNVPQFWVVDVSVNRVIGSIQLTAVPSISDWAFVGGYLWGADGNGTVVRVNPSTGRVDRFAGVLPTGQYGGVFVYGNGDLGMYDNAGRLHRVMVANPGAAQPGLTWITTQRGPASTYNDATSCVRS